MTPQEKKKVLKVIEEEIKTAGFLKLGNFGNVLERNGLSRELYGNSGPKRWLMSTFAEEVEIIGTQGRETITLLKKPVTPAPAPTPVPAPVIREELTEDVRRRFAAALSNQLEAYGMLLHSSIPGLLPDWTKYRTGSEKLGTWLSNTFPEDVFTTRTVNNAAALFFPQTAMDIDRIVQVVTEMILPTGIATVAAVSAELSRLELKWESIPVAHNQTLGEWLTDYCNNIVYTDASETALCFVKEADPGEAVAITDTVKQTVVYRYVFLPAAGAPLTALREILNDPMYTSAAWKQQSVNVCFDKLMGIGDGFLDDSDSPEPRMAFYTGLQTPEKQHIYCILVPNDAKNAAQRWRGSIFRYPGQNDPEGYGKWLCQKFGIPSENRDTLSGAYESIAGAIEEIENLQAELLQQFDEANRCIRQGDPVAEDFCSCITRYASRWSTVLKTIEELSISLPEEGSVMTNVKEFLNKKDNIAAVLDDLKAEYSELVVAAWNFMDNEVGALNGDAHPDADLEKWDSLLVNISLAEEEIKTIISDLLAPFRAMRTLTKASLPLSDAEMREWDIVEKHFYARLRLKDIKVSFIGAENGELDFLERIDEIEGRLKLLQIQSGAAVEEIAPVYNDRDLVERALVADNCVPMIMRHYPAPNAFEMAVASGDYAKAQRIAQDADQMADMGYDAAIQEHINLEMDKLSCNFSTPILTAGVNLARLQGNRNRQEEKYLLLAVYLKDGEAANHLAELYYREDRGELLALIYNNYGMKFPAENRQKYLCHLLDLGYLRISDVVETDLLGLLSIQDTAALDDFCNNLNLKEEAYQGLMQLREAIEEPFIRQVVFLDSELYRFIQQQENIESVCALGIQHTQESLGELLRLGRYPRGQDALSAARRIWYFVKDWNRLAEAVACLAGESDQKTELLWAIYQHRDDQPQMLRLLQQHPELQTNNQEMYGNLLFADGAYQEYFDAFTGAENTSVRMQLQLLVASIETGRWDGQFPWELDPAALAESKDVLILLNAALVDNDLAAEFCSFMLCCFEPLLLRCGGETTEHIVTANGRIPENVLLQLQEEAIRSENSALAVFLFRVLGNEDTGNYCETYYNKLWEELRGLDTAGQALGIRNLQLLFPDQYNRHYYQVFPYLLRNKLSTEQDRPEEAVLTVARMLTGECVREDNLPEILSILEEASMVSDPVILERLTMLCQTPELQDICLQFFHERREAFAGAADSFLCKLYSKALENDTLPRECLKDAERVALRRLQQEQDELAARCVCTIEEQLGREPYFKFVQLYLRGSEQEDAVTELSLMRQILEEPEWDLGEYLAFCDNFNLFSEKDQTNIEALLQPNQEGALTEAESIPLLHGLYENNREPEYLEAIVRLPFRDNPTAYARLLLYVARNSQDNTSAWRACANYCEKFRLDDTLIQVLLEMTQKENRDTGKYLQWYDAKESFASVRNLCNRAEGFPKLSNPETVRQLLEEMCTFFIKIDINSSNTVNHTSLRTIVELAVASGNEDIVIARLMDKLLGVHTKLGLVLACRLLVSQRYDRALRQFQALSRCYGQIPYKELIDRLSQMDCAELEAWSKQESSQMLLDHFLLPDGNRPDVQMLRCFLMTCITEDKAQVGIEVAEQLITYFPNDSICYKTLFVLCKENYMEHLPRIQRALAGLYIHYPVEKRAFYTRTRESVLKLLTVTSAVMQQQANPEAIMDVGDFIRKNCVMESYKLNDLVIEVSKQRDVVLNGFVGLNQDQCELMIYGLMGAVTGNWFVFQNAAFRARISSAELAEYVKRCGYTVWGLTRGFLQVYRGLDETDREAFQSWIKNAMAFMDEQPAALRAGINSALTLISKNNLDAVDPHFLALPWEEHVICLRDPREDAAESNVDSCYVWMIEHLRQMPEGYSANTTLHVFHRLAQDTYRNKRLYIDAEQCFNQGEFALALELYEFLDAIRAVPRDIRGMEKREAQTIQLEAKELYQARSRICRFLLGDETIFEKLRNMKAHSCTNITIALLQSPYSYELARMARTFSISNQRLCQTILKLVNPEISDSEKETIYNTVAPGQELVRLILAQILATPGKTPSGYLFVKNALFGSAMALASRPLVQEKYTVIKFTRQIHPRALSQLIELSEEEVEKDPELNKSDGRTDSFLPAFAMEAYAFMQNQQLPALEELQDQFDECSYDDYSRRLYCAQAIYYLVSQESAPEAEQTVAALLKLGQAYRDYHLSMLAPSANLSEEEKHQCRILAREALLELACYSGMMVRGRMLNLPVIRYAEGLQGILCNDFNSIDEIVSDYKKNQDDYQTMLQLITDSEIRGIVAKIFNQIHQLNQHYENGGPKDLNTTSYRIAYKDAYDALDQIPFNMGWNEAKNILLKHLMQAINDLDKRPYLDVKIFNDQTGNRQDVITGVLTNTGRVPAEKISIQVIYGADKLSDTYGYEELRPNEQVCFAVAYTAPAEANTLSYKLNITYFYREKEFVADPRTGMLELTETPALSQDIDLYGAHKELVFTTDESGNVVGKGFYGRNTEKRDLQQLAPENVEFSEYRAAVVQGFRRTGKTSLLHYFAEHIRSKCQDRAVAIYVDCEGFVNQPIQKAFVTSVLFGLENEMPQLAEKESWHRLKNMWMTTDNMADRDPDTLQFFYQSLGRELDGKGVVLIVDEVDRLFARVEENHGAASSLFPSLRAVQHNPNCKKAVCMLLCGSNNMLIYNQDGGKLYQLFEDFAKIKVGRLHKDEIEQMLTEPLAETGEMAYHPEAIEWIWRYTGGLVWYTKLLGNAAVNQAKAQHRRMIYPIDVSIAFDSIINEQNCKQYISEGCNDDARLVLDAISTLATRYGTDVTRSQIITLLDGALSENQLDTSLKLLTDTLGLLERSVNARNTYHFAVEIYRRFYRTQQSRFQRVEAPADRMSLTGLSPAAAPAAQQRRTLKKRN